MSENDYSQTIKNLRERAADPEIWGDKVQKEWTLDWAAADAITALREQIVKMREALEWIQKNSYDDQAGYRAALALTSTAQAVTKEK